MFWHRRLLCWIGVIGVGLVAAGYSPSGWSAEEDFADPETQAAPEEVRKGADQPTPPREFEFQVLDSHDRPVPGAKVKAWAVLAQLGSFGIDQGIVPAVESDPQGIARIKFPDEIPEGPPEVKALAQLLQQALKQGLMSVALRVDHPDHPLWSNYVPVAGDRKIRLAESVEIVIRSRRAGSDELLSKTYPVLSRQFFDGIEFSEEEGILTIRRVDRSTDQASNLVRVVQLPDEGPALFSDLVDLTTHDERPIVLDLTLKPTARLVGRVSGDVPRPIKNGRVVASIVAGPNSWEGWHWSATAAIAEDGRFVLDALPPEENLQLIVLCDGWVSASPAKDEVEQYGSENGLTVVNYQSSAGHVNPQLFRLSDGAIIRNIPMRRTAQCEVAVLDHLGEPLPEAAVSFWPNQFWINGGAQILGDGFDTRTLIREELQHGIRKDWPPPWNRNHRYTVKTDSQGIALVGNLPVAPVDDPTEMQFVINHDAYYSPNSPQEPFHKVRLRPGESKRVTVRLKAR
ncbi:MAG: hypothetical protein ACKV0T_02035 [Planctomycetales bacterium]